MSDFCDIPFLKLRDVPCGCASPPFQCEVDEYGDLPQCPNNFHISPPAPPNTLIENGDVYVVLNGAGGNPQPFFFWDCNWYPLAPPEAGDADWFVEGTIGPDYGLGLNTNKAYHNGPIAIDRTSARGNTSLDVGGQVLADGTFTGTPDAPISGTGMRMMWLPEVGAFRAGQAFGAGWDNLNIGEHSAAFGFRNIASGVMSFAANEANVASGRFSSAFGKFNIASYDNAFCAGGQENTAVGDDSFVAGARNVSAGPRSVVFGDFCVATGLRSFVHGELAESKSRQGVVFGNNIALDTAADSTFLVGDETGGTKVTYDQPFSFIVHKLRPFIHSPNSAPTDADIEPGHLSFWVDEGSNLLTFRVRYSTGTYKTGTLTLV